MENIILSDFKIAIIGYFSAFLGHFFSTIILYKLKNTARTSGFLLGLSGGLLLAFASFELLPISLFYTNIFYISLVIFLSFLSCMTIAHFVNTTNEYVINNKFDIATIALTLGLVNIPDALALGTTFNVEVETGLKLSIILMLHFIPTGVIILHSFKNTMLTSIDILVFNIFISLPMFVSTYFGYSFSKFNPNLIPIFISISIGSTLYVSLAEKIPESHNVWNGRTSILGILLGFLIGIMTIFSA